MSQDRGSQILFKGFQGSHEASRSVSGGVSAGLRSVAGRAQWRFKEVSEGVRMSV